LVRLKVVLLSAAAFVAPASAVCAQTAPAQIPAQSPAQSAPAKPAAKTPTTVKEVVATGQAGYRSSIDRKSYSLTGDLQAATGSIADALRNVPSVEVDVQGNVSLRGDSNVKILVDGKPSTLFSGGSRADALQQVQADQFERVEVMTNPSAAFSPDGTAGVINLISKKTKKGGRSATVKGNLGTDGRWNGSVSGSYVRSGLTLTGNAGGRHDEYTSNGFSELTRLDPVTGDPTLTSRQRYRNRSTNDSHNLHGGMDWDPDAQTRVSLSVGEWKGRSDGTNASSYRAEDASGSLTQASNLMGAFSYGFGGPWGSASWRRKLGGSDEHELSAELSWDRSDDDSRSRSLRVFAAPLQPDQFQLTHDQTTREQLTLKVDYVRPFGDGSRLESGLQVERSDGDVRDYGETGVDAGHTAVDPGLTQRFLYGQTVSAVYGTYQRPFGKLTAKAGLRLEQTNLDIDQKTQAIQAGNDYFAAYPTLHLAYDVTTTQQLTASYSRRVSRPQPDDLNPYVFQSSPYSRSAGNPDLKPSETDSFEAGWQYRSGSTFWLATAFWRENSNGVTDVTRDVGGGVLFTTKENLASSRNGGLELTANGRLFKTLRYNVSGTAAWSEIDPTPSTGLTQSRSGTALNGRASLNWDVTPRDFVQMSGYLRGETLTAQGTRSPGGVLNLGWRHKFDDRLALVVTAQDVLGTSKFETVTDTPTLKGKGGSDFSARAVFVGLTFTFGDGKKRDEGFDFGGGGGR
jgi:outer membrane receptor protein involved in Fe transport